MRLKSKKVATDHELTTGKGPDDHHPSVVTDRILVNSQAIGPGNYQLRIPLGKTGCKTLRAVLRGTINVDLQGHTGVFVVGSDTSGESTAVGLRPYPSGTQSYMGAYSRLHGDDYLRLFDFGQGVIRLRDCFIDGSDAVFEFNNSDVTARNLTVYGTYAAN